MRVSFTSVLLYTLLAGCLDAQVKPPATGYVRYDSLPIQGMYGIPGNFIPVGSAFGFADALSFSDTGGLVAAGGEIAVRRTDGSTMATYAYQGVTPLLSTSASGNAAAGWISGTHSLLLWDGKVFSTIPFDDGVLDGSICSLALVSVQTAHFFVSHLDGTVSVATVSLPGGNLLSSDSLPGTRGPVFQFGPLMIWTDEQGLEIQSASGPVKTLAGPTGSFSAEQMSSRWVHLYFPSTGTHWALNLSELILYRLPTPQTGKGDLR